MKGNIKRFIYKIFNRGSGRSMDSNRIYGKFKVKYPDGMISQNFYYDVAKN